MHVAEHLGHTPAPPRPWGLGVLRQGLRAAHTVEGCAKRYYCWSMRFWTERSVVVGRQARVKWSLLRSTQTDIAV